MSNLFKHIKTVKQHRKYVRQMCFKMGIPLRGLLHDLSKYSLAEMKVVKYYDGYRSPHEKMREELGYSCCWYHHRNKNKHHWEYFIDSLEDKLAVKMPYKYVIELICDMIGASRTYCKDIKTWKTNSVLNYWNLHDGPHRIIHPTTRTFIDYMFNTLACSESINDFTKWYKLNKKTLKIMYNKDNISELIV